MGFRGLEFGSGLNKFGDLIRQAEADKITRARQQEQDRINLFKAAQLGYDVGEDMFSTMANPGISEDEIFGAAAQRGPAGVDGPLANYGPNNPYPTNETRSTADLIAGLQSPQGQMGIQNLNNAAVRDRAANPQPVMRGRPQGPGYDEALKMAAKAPGDIARLQAQAGGPEQKGPDMIAQDAIKSMVQEALVSGRAKIDTNGRVLVHPELAKQIKDMKEMAFKQSLSGGKSDTIDKLIAGIVAAGAKKDVQVAGTPAKASKGPKGPSMMDIQRRMSQIVNKIPMGSKMGIERVMQRLSEADRQEYLNLEQMMRNQLSGGSSSQSNSTSKKVRYKGRMWTADELQKSHPDVYNKVKDRF